MKFHLVSEDTEVREANLCQPTATTECDEGAPGERDYRLLHAFIGGDVSQRCVDSSGTTTCS